eukprot:GHVU01043378.1.p1 GENE.GHVU01043378.1~~GHVU01043378.1.p1  ORF type:complete len:1949 (+),score=384.04 GHVU01043378.1:1428-7274(+)
MEEEVLGEYCCRMITQTPTGDKPAWIGMENVRIRTAAEFDSGATKNIISETSVTKLREHQEVISEKIVPIRFRLADSDQWMTSEEIIWTDLRVQTSPTKVLVIRRMRMYVMRGSQPTCILIGKNTQQRLHIEPGDAAAALCEHLLSERKSEDSDCPRTEIEDVKDQHIRRCHEDIGETSGWEILLLLTALIFAYGERMMNALALMLPFQWIGKEERIEERQDQSERCRVTRHEEMTEERRREWDGYESEEDEGQGWSSGEEETEDDKTHRITRKMAHDRIEEDLENAGITNGRSINRYHQLVDDIHDAFRTCLRKGDIATVRPMRVILKDGVAPCKLPARSGGEMANDVVQAWAMAGIEGGLFIKPKNGTTLWASPTHVVPRGKSEAIRIKPKLPEEEQIRRAYDQEAHRAQPEVFAWVESEELSDLIPKTRISEKKTETTKRRDSENREGTLKQGKTRRVNKGPRRKQEDIFEVVRMMRDEPPVKKTWPKNGEAALAAYGLAKHLQEDKEVPDSVKWWWKGNQTRLARLTTWELAAAADRRFGEEIMQFGNTFQGDEELLDEWDAEARGETPDWVVSYNWGEVTGSTEDEMEIPQGDTVPLSDSNWPRDGEAALIMYGIAKGFLKGERPRMTQLWWRAERHNLEGLPAWDLARAINTRFGEQLRSLGTPVTTSEELNILTTEARRSAPEWVIDESWGQRKIGETPATRSEEIQQLTQVVNKEEEERQLREKKLQEEEIERQSEEQKKKEEEERKSEEERKKVMEEERKRAKAEKKRKKKEDAEEAQRIAEAEWAAAEEKRKASERRKAEKKAAEEQRKAEEAAAAERERKQKEKEAIRETMRKLQEQLANLEGGGDTEMGGTGDLCDETPKARCSNRRDSPVKETPENELAARKMYMESVHVPKFEWDEREAEEWYRRDQARREANGYQRIHEINQSHKRNEVGGTNWIRSKKDEAYEERRRYVRENHERVHEYQQFCQQQGKDPENTENPLRKTSLDPSGRRLERPRYRREEDIIHRSGVTTEDDSRSPRRGSSRRVTRIEGAEQQAFNDERRGGRSRQEEEDANDDRILSNSIEEREAQRTGGRRTQRLTTEQQWQEQCANPSEEEKERQRKLFEYWGQNQGTKEQESEKQWSHTHANRGQPGSSRGPDLPDGRRIANDGAIVGQTQRTDRQQPQQRTNETREEGYRRLRVWEPVLKSGEAFEGIRDGIPGDIRKSEKKWTKIIQKNNSMRPKQLIGLGELQSECKQSDGDKQSVTEYQAGVINKIRKDWLQNQWLGNGLAAIFDRHLQRRSNEEMTHDEVLATWGLTRRDPPEMRKPMYGTYKLAVQRRFGGDWNQVGEVEEYGRATEVPMARAMFTNEGDQLPVDLEPLRERDTQVPRDGLIVMPRAGMEQGAERTAIAALARTLVRKLVWKERIPDGETWIKGQTEEILTYYVTKQRGWLQANDMTKKRMIEDTFWDLRRLTNWNGIWKIVVFPHLFISEDGKTIRFPSYRRNCIQVPPDDRPFGHLMYTRCGCPPSGAFRDRPPEDFMPPPGSQGEHLSRLGILPGGNYRGGHQGRGRPTRGTGNRGGQINRRTEEDSRPTTKESSPMSRSTPQQTKSPQQSEKNKDLPKAQKEKEDEGKTTKSEKTHKFSKPEKENAQEPQAYDEETRETELGTEIDENYSVIVVDILGFAGTGRYRQTRYNVQLEWDGESMEIPNILGYTTASIGKRYVLHTDRDRTSIPLTISIIDAAGESKNGENPDHGSVNINLLDGETDHRRAVYQLTRGNGANLSDVRVEVGISRWEDGRERLQSANTGARVSTTEQSEQGEGMGEDNGITSPTRGRSEEQEEKEEDIGEQRTGGYSPVMSPARGRSEEQEEKKEDIGEQKTNSPTTIMSPVRGRSEASDKIGEKTPEIGKEAATITNEPAASTETYTIERILGEPRRTTPYKYILSIQTINIL